MDINLSSSGKKIIASGSFITFDKEPNIISLKKAKEKLSLNLIFKNKPAENRSINFSAEKNTLKNEVIVNIFLTNFNSVLPTSFTSPISIAKWDTGEEIYLQLSIKSINDKIKEIIYTIYEVEKK